MKNIVSKNTRPTDNRTVIEHTTDSPKQTIPVTVDSTTAFVKKERVHIPTLDELFDHRLVSTLKLAGIGSYSALPRTEKELLALNGIGPATAFRILSILELLDEKFAE